MVAYCDVRLAKECVIGLRPRNLRGLDFGAIREGSGSLSPPDVLSISTSICLTSMIEKYKLTLYFYIAGRQFLFWSGNCTTGLVIGSYSINHYATTPSKRHVLPHLASAFLTSTNSTIRRRRHYRVTLTIIQLLWLLSLFPLLMLQSAQRFSNPGVTKLRVESDPQQQFITPSDCT